MLRQVALSSLVILAGCDLTSSVGPTNQVKFQNGVPVKGTASCQGVPLTGVNISSAQLSAQIAGQSITASSPSVSTEALGYAQQQAATVATLISLYCGELVGMPEGVPKQLAETRIDASLANLLTLVYQVKTASNDTQVQAATVASENTSNANQTQTAASTAPGVTALTPAGAGAPASVSQVGTAPVGAHNQPTPTITETLTTAAAAVNAVNAAQSTAPTKSAAP